MVLKDRRGPADPVPVDLRSDRGEIILGWLTKLTLVLSVLGLVAFDGISLVQARFQAADRAQQAAGAAARAYGSSPDVQKAYEAALLEVAASGDTIAPTEFAIAPDGAVTVTVRRTAPTLVVEKVGPLRPYAEVASSATARRPR